VLSDRQSFYLSNEAEGDVGEVAQEFILQYYGGQTSIPPQLIVEPQLMERERSEREALAEVLAARRGGPVQIKVAERGDKRRILELARRNAMLALDTERLRAERRRQSRAEALDGLQRALGLESVPVRIECFDISNLGGTHTVASMVVFEAGIAKRADYRRFNIRTIEDPARPDDFASMEEVLSRRLSQWERQLEISPHDRAYDASFATLPSLIVIDGGKGQLAAGIRALRGFREQGVSVISLAKRIEEVFLQGRAKPLVLDHTTPELQLLQRVRDEAHRFAITHHRGRRDKAMTSSLLDELPGIGPTRKRALLTHFGSPEGVLSASREDLQAVPGLPPKVGRELHGHLHRTG
jgi:excinuclease ABC subunit C